MINRRYLAGFSLIQLMVAMAVGSIIVIGVIDAFTGQANSFRQETARDRVNSEINSTFNTVSSLLRHAIVNSFSVSYGAKGQRNSVDQETKRITPFLADDEITVDFLLPVGLPIWPNDTTPFINHAVRIKWTNNDNSDNRDTIMIGTARSLTGLANATMVRLAGTAEEGSSHITNFDLWPLALNGTPALNSSDSPKGGFALQINARSGQIDPSYVNPADPSGILKHYRMATASGAVNPRN